MRRCQASDRTWVSVLHVLRWWRPWRADSSETSACGRALWSLRHGDLTSSRQNLIRESAAYSKRLTRVDRISRRSFRCWRHRSLGITYTEFLPGFEFLACEPLHLKDSFHLIFYKTISFLIWFIQLIFKTILYKKKSTLPFSNFLTGRPLRSHNSVLRA